MHTIERAQTTTWAGAYAVHFGYIAPEDVPAMEAEIRAAIPDTMPGETLAAVRAIAQQRTTSQRNDDYKPTPKAIVAQIRANRRQPTAQQTDAELIATLKKALKNAPGHATRWDIICDGTPTDRIPIERAHMICPALEDWTRRTWPDFQRPRLATPQTIFNATRHAADQKARTQ